MKIANFAVALMFILIGVSNVHADPAPSFYYPGPGLNVPLSESLQPSRYGVVLSDTGSWTFSAGAAYTENGVVQYQTTKAAELAQRHMMNQTVLIN